MSLMSLSFVMSVLLSLAVSLSFVMSVLLSLAVSLSLDATLKYQTCSYISRLYAYTEVYTLV